MKLVRETKKASNGKAYYNYYLVKGSVKISIKPTFINQYSLLKALYLTETEEVK